ncbi:N-acetylmuramoyl-L-alanine amidase LytC precursor [Peptococcaceae bacterium CEB3]|nr:N-acetylmuramoyl-L-alanine amidase LytC precursor [Peptococcaceae bacterium CEB3]
MKKGKWLTRLLTIAVACSLTALQPLVAVADTGSASAPVATATPTATVSAPSTSLRLAGVDRYQTAAKIADTGWKTTSDYAIVAAGMDQNLVDALTAAPLAKALNAPILLTQGDSLNSYTQAELKRLQVKTVYVTSGSGVIQKAVTDQIKAMGITVTSLGGTDRFATAVNIAQTLGSLEKVSQAVVATAYSNADALSVASIAAAQGMPILLTNVNSLPAVTASYLGNLKPNLKSTYVIGGTGAVSSAVKALLPNAERIGGVDRFDTNRLVIKAFAPELNYGTVYVANGEDAHLVDALMAAPMAALTGSPVVLSDAQLPAATLAFVKASLLPRSVVALGGKSVIADSALSALTSATAYTTAGATEGSSDPANKRSLSDSVLISADNVTLENAVAPYSIYVSGNNATLNNVQVTGTVFLDPGADGAATLNNVKAAGIVVLSGGTNSIHLNNVTADTLTLDSSSNVHIQTSGSTSLATTYVSTPGILDASSGTFGPVIVVRPLVPGGTVELRGTFTQPVIVEGAANIVAAPGASIALLTIAPLAAGAQVGLSGNFAAVKVTSPANVALAAGSVVSSMITAAQANIQIPPTASIASLVDQGSTGTLVSGGGTVNGQATSTTPSAPPSGGTTPPVTPPAGGGGSIGGGGGGVTPPSVTISSFSVTSGTGSVGTGTVTGGTSGTVDLSSYPNTTMVTGLALNAPAGCTLTITQINSPKTGTVTLSKSLSSVSSITVSELLGGLISGGDVSLGSMRGVFGSQVSFTGTLACSGYTSSSVTLTMELGSTSGIINNNYATMSVSGNTITATIKPGMGTTRLSSMGLYSLLYMAGQVPSWVTTDSSDWTSSTHGGAPSGSTGRQAIENAIVNLITPSAPGTTWSTATLSQLAGKSIYFKKIGDATTVYTLTIIN